MNDPLIYTGFEFKGTFYKALNGSTLKLLEKIQSPFFTGEGSDMEGLLDFLFVHSQPIKVVNRWCNDKEGFSDAVAEFGEQFGIKDLQELAELVKQGSDVLTSAIVEPEKKTGE
jgi:hypothetical protein